MMLFAFVGYAVAQWLGVRLQMFGVVMVAGVSFIAVLQHHFSTVNPGTYTPCGFLPWCDMSSGDDGTCMCRRNAIVMLGL